MSKKPNDADQTIFHLGLIGWPLRSSWSPALHQAALETAGLTGDYRLFPVPEGEAGQPRLADLLSQIRQSRIDGLNVTIPHKQSVIPLVDRLTPVAAAVGAINTLYLEGDQLVGDNTDVAGFREDLRQATGWAIERPAENPTGGRAWVLGAGGAARAVVYVLAGLGWQVNLAARRISQAEDLLRDLSPILPPQRVETRAWDLTPATLRQAAAHPALIVNTTPVGMGAVSEATPWQADAGLPPAGFIYDLITTPRETVLLKQGRAAGLSGVNGLGMLVEQAALSFTIWTHHPADRPAMRAAVDGE